MLSETEKCSDVGQKLLAEGVSTTAVNRECLEVFTSCLFFWLWMVIQLFWHRDVTFHVAGLSTKLSYVKPGQYWDWWRPFSRLPSRYMSRLTHPSA